MIFPIRTNSDILVQNIDKALDIIKNSKLKDSTKEELYKLLEFDIDNSIHHDSQRPWDWEELENSIENLVPEKASLVEVDKLKECVKNIKNPTF